jgi:hypothetical protein
VAAGLATAAAAPSSPRRVDIKAFEWEVGVDPIVLGDTTEVPITLTASLSDGSVLDIAPPILRASTGSIAPPERTEPGKWTTTFTPPPERFPHVAILSAQVDQAEGSVIGFVSVPLWGKGRLKVKTKPSSDVVAYIGNEEFGPAKADDEGVAWVDILAPPGPERAVAHSKDIAGNESQKVVDLGVPPFNRLALIAVDEVAAADGSSEAQLLAFAVDKKGQPLFEAVLEVSASVGAFEGDPLAISPGVFRLRYRPGEAPTGEATIDVGLPGAPASRAQAKVRLLSGPPVRAELEATPDALTVDDDPVVTVTARLFDQAGNTTPPNAGRFDVDVGRIDKRDVIDDDGVSVRWVLPSQVPATPPTLTARTTQGDVVGTISVQVRPGRAVSLSLDAIESVVADGESSAAVVVRAVDRAGNAVIAPDLELSMADAEIVGRSEEDGVVFARLVPAVSDQEELRTLTATSGTLRASTRVRVLPRPRARLLVGAGLAAGWNYGLMLSGGAELSFLVRVPRLLDESFHAGLSLGGLAAIPGELETPSGVAVTRQHRAFPLHAEVAWRPLLTQELSAHVGGGLGLVFSDLELVPAGAGVTAQRTVTPAASLQAVGGLAYRLGPGFVEADLRVGWAQPLSAGFGWTPLGTALIVGYRFGL